MDAEGGVLPGGAPRLHLLLRQADARVLGDGRGPRFRAQRVFAKVNAHEVLRQELKRKMVRVACVRASISSSASPASDPYEPADAEYQLTRNVLQVLVDFANPCSITTKGVLVRRDVDLLRELSEVAEVSVNFSIGTVDDEIWKQMEPGAPRPQSRLEAMQHLVENGINAGVMMAPLLPGISDHEENIAAVAEAAHNHGAQFLGSNVLFLKPGSKEWFMPMLKETYPHLEQAYAKLYRKTYAPEEYTRSVLSIVDRERRRWGLHKRERDPAPRPVRGQLQFSLTEETPRRRRKSTPATPVPQTGQLELALTA
ncbi:Uncharacterized protein Mb2609c [Geodia barretti]|uniref:Uncharacterized protein Mb2609c n=1 Tax=Geodia barretti TaxID=519541 RepID=A0AA35R5K9_GEOBA|nr:Uncharacterized protein Mb2609c [Geodia barretti]